ncbi:Fc receptor-like protein 5 isoform X3 [Mobula hypostoma]|uniref:Fc receptor-like protein 5 isoform X3 n=1 Tax=Mobula hypostoma TaxID=723540 RepID=UPI002FC34CC0
MMWTLILLIGFLPVSGALWAEKYVRGVVGRAITIHCHYEAKYHSRTKYWCHGWTHQCSVLMETNGQHRRSGRASITDNPEWEIFTVTVEDLHSGDTGWYSCGISTPGHDPIFNVHLQVSDETVSVPVLRNLSPANVSHLGGSVLVSCESLQGSLPIQYSWYEQTSSGDQMISDTNELVLPCQSLDLQAHQYYCKASNRLGIKSSGMLNVTIFNSREICGYVTRINGTKPVSVPVLQFLSPANVSCVEGSVSVSCESVQGSLPIQYTWYENTSSVISVTSKLDLHCQSFNYQHHQYYCTASNTCGAKSSEIVNVSIYNREGNCSFVIQITGTGREYSCETFTTVSTVSFMIWKVGRWLLFALLLTCTISVSWFTRQIKRHNESDPHRLVHKEGREKETRHEHFQSQYRGLKGEQGMEIKAGC